MLATLGRVMQYDRIPAELKGFRQWVVWAYEDDGAGKPTKVPYAPRKHKTNAKTNDPDTWGTFDECLQILQENPGLYAGLGFVLSENDPFIFIDLDDTKGNADNYQRQLKVYNTFNTYAELSPSGNGLHLIGIGAVPSGRKRSSIEIYSSGRFMTMTGNVFADLPIRDVTEIAQTLWSQMGKDKAKDFYDPNAPQLYSDMEILDTAANAANSVKFLDLYNGYWQQYPEYPSQSEADQALINILAFHTQNREQITRIFRDSALGQRAKSKRKDYIEWTTNRAFDMILPPVDIEGLSAGIETMLKKKAAASDAQATAHPVSREDSANESSATSGTDTGTEPPYTSSRYVGRNDVPLHLMQPPPGLVGDIARFIYEQSPRQVPEAALAGAIGLMSGLCGRAYHVSNTGLNQYTMFLGATGVGKEGMTGGIDKLVKAVSQYCPQINDYFGPSKFASGQGLLKAVEKRNCFVSIIGELSSMIRQISNERRSPSDEALREFLLGLYQKNTDAGLFRPMAYSDETKNTATIIRPSVSLLGEAQPEHIFDQCDENLITSGLLPRFTIIEFKGSVPYLNQGFATVQPSKDLVEKLTTLAQMISQMDANNKYQTVNFTPDAKDLLDKFERVCTDRINAAGANISKYLWNRAHLKTLKLAALLAVGLNPYNPIIDVVSANWAKSLILFDIANLVERYDAGQLGNYAENVEINQHNNMMEVIREYLTCEWEPKLIGYGTTRELHSKKVIPFTYLSRKCRNLKAFRKSKWGNTKAIRDTAQLLCDEAVLKLIPLSQAAKDFDYSGGLYTVPGYYELMMNDKGRP